MRNTIKKHKDFEMTATDPSARSAFFIVRAKSAHIPNDPRVGFVATKHTFRFATDRNRAKRLMRDWVLFCEHLMLSEFDYVFIARGSILSADRESGRDAMARALTHIMRKYGPKKKTQKKRKNKKIITNVA